MSQHLMDQGSPEWGMVRLGKITGSRICDLMAKGKDGKPSASRANYRAELAIERLTGIPTKDGFSNFHTDRGTELEPAARNAYCQRFQTLVEQVGFIDHPIIEMFGVSPDGLVDPDGMAQIKCPNAAHHIETILAKAPPSKYVPQMQIEMAVCGRAWSDYVSFHPDFPDGLQLVVLRVPADPEYQAKVAAEVVRFSAEIDELVLKLQTCAA